MFGQTSIRIPNFCFFFFPRRIFNYGSSTVFLSYRSVKDDCQSVISLNRVCPCICFVRYLVVFASIVTKVSVFWHCNQHFDRSKSSNGKIPTATATGNKGRAGGAVDRVSMADPSHSGAVLDSSDRSSYHFDALSSTENALVFHRRKYLASIVFCLFFGTTSCHSIDKVYNWKTEKKGPKVYWLTEQSAFLRSIAVAHSPSQVGLNLWTWWCCCCSCCCWRASRNDFRLCYRSDALGQSCMHHLGLYSFAIDWEKSELANYAQCFSSGRFDPSSSSFCSIADLFAFPYSILSSSGKVLLI